MIKCELGSVTASPALAPSPSSDNPDPSLAHQATKLGPDLPAPFADSRGHFLMTDVLTRDTGRGKEASRTGGDGRARSRELGRGGRSHRQTGETLLLTGRCTLRGSAGPQPVASLESSKEGGGRRSERADVVGRGPEAGGGEHAPKGCSSLNFDRTIVVGWDRRGLCRET